MTKMNSILRILCLLFVVACARDVVPSPPPIRKIVLITIDGVRWQDLYYDYLSTDPFSNKPEDYVIPSKTITPNIHKYFIEGGIAAGLLSEVKVESKAAVSLPGYLEILRGKAVNDCTDNNCDGGFERFAAIERHHTTLIDDFKYDAAVFAGWDTIAQTFNIDYAVANIGWKVRSPLWKQYNLPENNPTFNLFNDDEYLEDHIMFLNVRDFLSEFEQPSFTWISYGNTDEWAHLGNWQKYLKALHNADAQIGEMVRRLDPNNVYIICPDHGRMNEDWRNHHWDQGSHKVWVLIGGGGIEKVGHVKYDTDMYLSDIRATINEVAFEKRTVRSFLNYKR